MQADRRFRTAAAVCRVVLGAVFIFSGLVKSIDPWGTALKIEEYLTAFGMEGLAGLAAPLAIGQCALELTLGLMLVSAVWLKAAAFLTLIFMIFFTALTLVIAVWNPVDDCGCFGEALKLSNWMTFAKNALLLPISAVVSRAARKQSLRRVSRRDGALTAAYIAGSLAVNIYCWYNLPPVDTFAYREGTDLRTDVLCTSCIQRSLVLVYEDTQSGELREFRVSDTTWYDASRWRYVDTRTAYDHLPQEAQEFDFALWRAGTDSAEEIVFAEGDTYMVMVRDGGRLTRRCRERIGNFVSSAAAGDRIIYVGGTDGGADEMNEILIGGRLLPVYGMDRRLMAQMLRADAGVVKITDGVVVEKRPCGGIGRIVRGSGVENDGI